CSIYHNLGLKERAREALRGFSIDFDQYPPHYAELARDRLDIYRNPDPAFGQTLLDRYRRSKRRQVEWHLHLGNRRLGEHDRAGAFYHYGQAVAAPEPYVQAFKPSRAYLKRMQVDPTWPPWIPAKQ